MTTYRCGCINEVHKPSGILHSISKCRAHQRQARDPATWGRGHYASFGLLTDDDRLAETAHAAELIEALGPLPIALGNGEALEIGCGVSPYVGAIRDAGWGYIGVDLSQWAADWMWCNLFAYVVMTSWELCHGSSRYGLILSAHALEHMQDAPAALQKMADALLTGGQLWLVVPDDEDPINPDHLWMFTPQTLRSAVEAVGLTVERLETHRRVKHENFLYCRAVKP
jgi:SAM-dependent methyltransferase